MRSTGMAALGLVALLTTAASGHEIASEANGDVAAPFDIARLRSCCTSDDTALADDDIARLSRGLDR